MKTKLRLISIVYLILLFVSCKKEESTVEVQKLDNLKIAVFSDPHYMDPSLIKKDGKALEKYLDEDRKLLKESPYIIEELVKRVKAENPDIVLIPGDLTKDGEYVSNKNFADKYLKDLEASGIKVYVVPGNHDVNNPHSVIYNGDEMQRTKTTSKDEFAEIYKDYGYGEAIARDEHSLSYVAELSPKLRLLALDVCKYELNDYEKNTCITGGRIKPETMLFIEKQAAEAKAKGIRLFVMQHHGLIEHFPNQSVVMPEYLIDNWRMSANKFIELGINIVFTGHFHAQDIVRYSNGGEDLYDIETGSTVTYPCPFRIMNYDGKVLSIKSKKIEHINYSITDAKDFQTYAKNYVERGLSGIVSSYANELPEEYKNQELLGLVGRMATDAFVAHYKGDESISSNQQKNIDMYNVIADKYTIPNQLRTVINVVNSVWTDLAPEDNSVDISFR
ncbi:MAG: metallophosphoesterase [Marinifilaceae bacterium]|nr:metallophosphoesterase [Marinifilaceae bacterium]